MASSARDVIELACLQNSGVKGHQNNSRTGDRLCMKESTHSSVAIVIKCESQMIGHAPERLAGIHSLMIEERRIKRNDGLS